MELTEDLRRILLGVLQRGITEARTLLLTGDVATGTDLLDALDGIPRHLGNWTATSFSEIRTNLNGFAQRHRDHSTDYEWVLNEMRDLL